MPRIFVFIPAYNAASFIAETIESVRAQTHSEWEMTIIDDASSDDTLDACRRAIGTDPRITLIANDKNLGMVGNWNKGISLCNSEYFVKLDADDIWRPTFLEESVKIMDTLPNVGLVFSKFVNIDDKSRQVPDSEIELPPFARDCAFSCVPLVKLGSSKMLQFPILRQGLSLTRSSIFSKVGPYRYLLSRQTQAASDTEFYFRVGCNFDIFCIDKTLYEYRVHGRSISAEDKQANLQEQKLFEVKTVINDYYRTERKIGFLEWWRNRRATNFQYRLFLNYRARAERRIGRFFQSCAVLIFLHPVNTFGHLLSKISSNY